MIISHDRQTLFIGVPKNGSQTARAVLGQIGVDLVGEMGRHPTVPESIRLAEARFGKLPSVDVTGIRQRTGLSQSAFAASIGVPEGTLVN